MRSMIRWTSGVVVVAATLICGRADAWNSTGHMSVADIAFGSLDPKTLPILQDLLGAVPGDSDHGGPETPEQIRVALQRAATWPDRMRKTPEDRPVWHYINLPVVRRGGTFNAEDRTSLDPVKPGESPKNVVQALAFNRAILADGTKDKRSRAVALCWVLHLVGDIHQPLHAAGLWSAEYPDGDEGGNLALVRDANGKQWKLHTYWDDLLGTTELPADIESIGGEVADHHPRSEFTGDLAQGTDFSAWATKSRELAEKLAYTTPFVSARQVKEEHQTVPTITSRYAADAHDLAEQRVALAGYRLADLLNETLLGGTHAVPGASLDGLVPPAPPGPASLPRYNHVVIVIEENKDYEQILDGQTPHAAPYINSVLKAEGASFTRMFGEEHNSQGNYFWLFSGSDQGVDYLDTVPTAQFTTSNLGEQLIAKGWTFKCYSESLPSPGFAGNLSPDPEKDPHQDALYARKHAPWVSFGNLPKATESWNLQFADFPTDAAQFGTLPTVSFVIPNLKNDMHDGKPQDSVPKGDTWLKDHLNAYYQWAKANNSLLIVTFDENDDKSHYHGLTDPSVDPQDMASHDRQNRIATIFAGAHIRPGDYDEGKGITHVNILRTLEAIYGLPTSGAQQAAAARFGIRDDYVISDVFN